MFDENKYEVFVNGISIAKDTALKYALVLAKGAFEEESPEPGMEVFEVSIRVMPQA